MTWGTWYFDEPRSLARYVQREDLDAAGLLGAIAERPPGTAELAGYVYQQLRGLGLRYDVSLLSRDGAAQVVQAPYTIIHRKRAGSCLDLSLIYAGLCLVVGLYPVIAVLQYKDRRRHAFVLVRDVPPGAGHGDVWQGRFGLEEGLWTPTADMLREEIKEGNWIAVETTCATDHFGASCSFEEARQRGAEAIGDARRIHAVDVGHLLAERNYAVEPGVSLVFPTGPAGANEPNEATGQAARTGRAGPSEPSEEYGNRVAGEIRRRYEKQLAGLRTRLDLPSLTDLVPTLGGDGRALVQALAEGLLAKRTFRAIGGEIPKMEELHHLFFDAASSEVAAESADVLLIEAALAGSRSGLSVLARFMLSVAHRNDVGLEHPVLRDWLDRHDAQGNNVRDYLESRAEKHWVLFEIGGPDLVGNAAEPEDVRISVQVHPAVRMGRIQARYCKRAEVKSALREMMTRLCEGLGGRELFIELIAPLHLLEEGYEQIDLAPGQPHRPRLRWYGHMWGSEGMKQTQRRRHDAADWAGDPALVTDEAAVDEQALKAWLRRNLQFPYVVAERANADTCELLKGLLRNGCGYILWYPERAYATVAEDVREVWAGLDSSNRRIFFPDKLLDQSHAAPISVIWSDPGGRGPFRVSDVRPGKRGGALRGTRKRATA
ncbi:hypothetical protein [Actinomadura sediminis]|uniref:Uncharacterized protein n=1 Tax=Actinomadura sediminis TaxID=1038904 RepID=A0ABW3EJ92_9ACTN